MREGTGTECDRGRLGADRARPRTDEIGTLVEAARRDCDAGRGADTKFLPHKGVSLSPHRAKCILRGK